MTVEVQQSVSAPFQVPSVNAGCANNSISSVYCTNLLMLSLAAHLSIALLLDTTLQLLNVYAMCAASQV